MKIIQTISQFEHIPKGCVLTIGNFDGVHVGHQEILAVARQAAEKNNTELIAMVFDPHPVASTNPPGHQEAPAGKVRRKQADRAENQPQAA